MVESGDQNINPAMMLWVMTNTRKQLTQCIDIANVGGGGRHLPDWIFKTKLKNVKNVRTL